MNASHEMSIEVSGEVDREMVEALQLEVTRLLQQHGLRVTNVTVARGLTTAADADEVESGSADVS